MLTARRPRAMTKARGAYPPLWPESARRWLQPVRGWLLPRLAACEPCPLLALRRRRLWVVRFGQGLDLGVRVGRCTHLLQGVGDNLAPQLHLRTLRSVPWVEVAIQAAFNLDARSFREF